MNFNLATALVQGVGLLYFIGIIALVVTVVLALVNIRKNTEQTNKRLESIERLLAENLQKKE